jgi:hypothetical protein
MPCAIRTIIGDFRPLQVPLKELTNSALHNRWPGAGGHGKHRDQRLSKRRRGKRDPNQTCGRGHVPG